MMSRLPSVSNFVNHPFVTADGIKRVFGTNSNFAPPSFAVPVSSGVPGRDNTRAGQIMREGFNRAHMMDTMNKLKPPIHIRPEVITFGLLVYYDHLGQTVVFSEKGKMAGHMGGKIEATDDSLGSGLLREISEETPEFEAQLETKLPPPDLNKDIIYVIRDPTLTMGFPMFVVLARKVANLTSIFPEKFVTTNPERVEAKALVDFLVANDHRLKPYKFADLSTLDLAYESFADVPIETSEPSKIEVVEEGESSSQQQIKLRDDIDIVKDEAVEINLETESKMNVPIPETIPEVRSVVDDITLVKQDSAHLDEIVEPKAEAEVVSSPMESVAPLPTEETKKI